jgi:hypothetical protein
MKQLLMIMICCTLQVPSLWAEQGDGGYAGAFLRLGIGARARALGDAHTAIPEDAVAGIYNPALLPHLESRYLTFSTAFLSLDRHVDFIGYAQSVQPGSEEDKAPLKAGFMLAWIKSGVDEIDGRDFNGRSTGELSHSEHAFYLSFALNPHPMLSIGVSGKVLYSRFPNMDRENNAVSATGFGIDVGGYLTPISGLHLGLVLRDNLSKYEWNTDSVYERGTSTVNHFPQVLRAAIAYRIPQKWLLITGEMENSDQQNPRVHLGSEFSLSNVGCLRIGWDDSFPTFGLGLMFSVWGHHTIIDYAYAAVENAPRADHIFSWSLFL